jgi:hypothetical protein
MLQREECGKIIAGKQSNNIKLSEIKDKMATINHADIVQMLCTRSAEIHIRPCCTKEKGIGRERTEGVGGMQRTSPGSRFRHSF